MSDEMFDDVRRVRRPKAASKDKFKKFNKKDSRTFRLRRSELEDEDLESDLQRLRNCSIEDLDDPFEDDIRAEDESLILGGPDDGSVLQPTVDTEVVNEETVIVEEQH